MYESHKIILLNFSFLGNNVAMLTLIAHHTDLTIKNNDGYAPLNYAIEQGKLTWHNYQIQMHFEVVTLSVCFLF